MRSSLHRLAGRRRPSPSMVIACVALFIALSGSAMAASTMIRSSAQIASGAVTSSDIRDKTVNVRDLSAKARTALTGARGATGATGTTGANGAQGPQGPAGKDGAPGIPGNDGAAGKDGLNGKDGKDGKDAVTRFARVEDDGTLSPDPGLVRNVIQGEVAHPATGVYCFSSGKLPLPGAAVATATQDSLIANVKMSTDGNIGGCPALTFTRVTLRDANFNLALTDGDFEVIFVS